MRQAASAARAATSASASSTSGGATPLCASPHERLALSVRSEVFARTAGRKQCPRHPQAWRFLTMY